MSDPVLYEKCLGCHLFVADEDGATVHYHRGDEPDTALDESHPATHSGMFATLETWRTFGPDAMRARFREESGECDHRWQLVEEGYLRYWDAEIREDGTVSAIADGFSDDGEGDMYLFCKECSERRELPDECEIDYA